jgi:hypothetical protein
MTPEEDREAVEISVTPGRLSARLRPLMPEIDRLVRGGVTHDEVVEGLREKGIEVSRETFRKNLYRYRRKAVALATAPETLQPKADQVVDDVVTRVPAPPPPAQPAIQPRPSGPLSLEELMDPKKRDAFADQYLTSPRRRLGEKKES